MNQLLPSKWSKSLLSMCCVKQKATEIRCQSLLMLLNQL